MNTTRHELYKQQRYDHNSKTSKQHEVTKKQQQQHDMTKATKPDRKRNINIVTVVDKYNGMFNVWNPENITAYPWYRGKFLGGWILLSSRPLKIAKNSHLSRKNRRHDKWRGI